MFYRSVHSGSPSSSSRGACSGGAADAHHAAACYVPTGLQRPPSRSTAAHPAAANGGHQPPKYTTTYATNVAADTYNAPQQHLKMSAQIAQVSAASCSASAPSSGPNTPLKRKPLGDASFITQAGRAGSGTPIKKAAPSYMQQYSPVKLPPTPSRQPSAAVTLLRSHALQHHRPLLVLDLDETLVHASVETSDGNHDVAFVVEMNQQRINVFVKIRPFAREFLRRVASLFEVCVFTASLAPYADRVVDYLDPSGHFVHHRLYREHCTNVDGNYIKDMSLMGRSLERVAIVDNSPVAYSFHPENAIPILSWFDDRNDRELVELMPMLEHFSQSCDFFRTARKFNININNNHSIKP